MEPAAAAAPPAEDCANRARLSSTATTNLSNPLPILVTNDAELDVVVRVPRGSSETKCSSDLGEEDDAVVEDITEEALVVGSCAPVSDAPNAAPTKHASGTSSANKEE